MQKTSRTLLLIACTAFIGGISCSDDSPANPPANDAGPDAGASDVRSNTTSSGAISSGGLASETTSEVPATSTETVVSETSSTEPDASDGTSAPSNDGGALDAAVDASDGSTSETETMDGATSAPGTDASVGVVDFIPPRGACDIANRIGRFTIEAQSDFGVVQGSVSTGVLPATIPSVDSESGDCRLNKRRTLSCLPACVAGETCGEGGQCIPFPEPVSAGEVTIAGLTKPTTMVAQAPSYLYFAPGANNPPFAPLSEITLSATGAAVPSFNLFGVGSEPLTESPTWILDEGEDFEITWPATDASAGTTVLVEITVDQHGASPLSLSCEFADTGSAVVPASMIDSLLLAGISGFPNGRLTRRTVDHVDVESGCIELTVGSPRTASIVVAGHTPCNGPEDCPNDQHCNLTIEQCEDN